MARRSRLIVNFLLLISVVKAAEIDICPEGVLKYPDECEEKNVIPIKYHPGQPHDEYVLNRVCCKQVCGVRNYEIKANEFPSAVLILEETSIGPKKIVYSKCGGSLISANVVLTTAHCVEIIDKSKSYIAAGMLKAKHAEDVLSDSYQKRYIDKIIKHEEFVSDAHLNNIALIVLEKPFILNRYVGTACFISGDIDDDNCVVAGGDKPVIEHLRIIERNHCEKVLRQTKLGSDFELHSTFTCAIGKQGKDACLGDGGKGLLCPFRGKNDEYSLVGMVSWGIDDKNNCDEKSVPGVYVDVYEYDKWIEQKFKEHNLNIDDTEDDYPLER
uniref:CSON010815 protein n=1 Tax=Culicoides sonorensis TaxID=179676 RepID=A0A336MZP3_CULSO